MVARLRWLFVLTSVLVGVHMPSQAMPSSIGWNPRTALASLVSKGGAISPKSKFSAERSRSSKQKQSLRKRSTGRLSRAIHSVVSGTTKPGPRFFHHVLYWWTAVDAVHSVWQNEYSNSSHMLLGIFAADRKTSRGVPHLYSQLFYFARLRPRLLFAIGALLRALQLCTPFCRLLDPSVGVGAGINLCAMLARSRWVKPIILGWATTKWAWAWLGATQVENSHVPITLTIRHFNFWDRFF